MNPKAKLGACLGAGAIIAGATGYFAGFPFGDLPFAIWLPVCSLSLGLLFATFEVSLRSLQRTAGVVVLLAVLGVVFARSGENALSRSTLLELFNLHGELGVVCLGASLLIIAGGIDLSIGSVAVLSAVLFGVLMENGVHPLLAFPTVLIAGVAIGLIQGLLVTQLKLQAFLVTLCGMFAFRGIARTLRTGQVGFGTVKSTRPEDWPGFGDALYGMRYWLTGITPPGAVGGGERLVFPGQLAVLLALAAIAAVFLHSSAFGRYWYAIGYNEQATRYAGITTSRHKLSLFAICSGLASLSGLLLFLRSGTVTMSTDAQSLELYAITAAVLGGVSLKGGEGTAIGAVLGAMVIPLIQKVMNFLECPKDWEPWMIGGILLLGTIVDELIRRSSRARK